MMKIFFFVLCLATCSARHRIDGGQNALKADLELESPQKLIKKPPIKTIHTKFGEIIDCIDIKKQPAFDHPLLKNHKLQRKPSFQKSIKKTSAKNSPFNPILGPKKILCPTGTVPIPRTIKDDFIQAKSLLNYHIKTQDIPRIHIAEISLSSHFGPYYHVSGHISIYNPKVRKDQISAAFLWLENGENANNRIAAGWHVSPQSYGDYATHIFGAWTSDNFKDTGCFNSKCPGFIQISKTNYVVDNPSTPGAITELKFSITQDPVTKNWWLVMKDENIGYFPAVMFSNMSSPSKGGWGGRTATPTGTPSPPMGSGAFPNGKLNDACFFRHISFQNSSRQDYGPEMFKTTAFADRSDCYRANYYGQGAQPAGYYLQFGGPGGKCGD